MLEVANGALIVDELGNVYSVFNNAGNRRAKPKLRKPFLHKEGYLSIRTTDACHLVHRLVAIAYIPNPLNKPEVNHKDGVKSNNVATNLEWATASENSIHAFETKLRTTNIGQKGRTNDLSVLSKQVVQMDLQKNILQIFPSLAEAQRQGFSQGNISSVIAGNRKSHKGFLWAFA